MVFVFQSRQNPGSGIEPCVAGDLIEDAGRGLISSVSERTVSMFARRRHFPDKLLRDMRADVPVPIKAA